MLSFLLFKTVSSVTIGPLNYTLVEGMGAIVSGMSKVEKMVNLSINSTIETNNKTYNVLAVGEFAFFMSPLYGNLVLPDTMLFIYSFAFAGTNITSIKFGKSMAIIDNQAFILCLYLSCELVLPKSVIQLGNSCFEGCPVTGNIDGSNIQNLGNSCFKNTNIKSFIFNQNITIVPNYAFLGSSLSGTVVLPDKVEIIGMMAFYDANISSINFPPKLRIIYDGAFFVTYMRKPENTAQGITGDVVFPDSLIVIGFQSFSNNSMTSIKFGKNLEKISDAAFGFCSKLSCEIVLPKSLKYLGAMAFAYTSIKGTVDGTNLEFLGHSCFQASNINSFLFPSSIVEVPDNFFANSMLSGEIVLPLTVRRIGKSSFCSTEITSINFPAQLRVIDYIAFQSCTKLSCSLKSEKMEYIGEGAFASTQITFFGLECKEIGISAFANCKALVGTVIVRAEKLGNGVFMQCPNINIFELTYNHSIPLKTFAYCTSLKSVIIFYVDSGQLIEIEEYAFAYCTLLQEIAIPLTVESIGDMAFYCCRSFTRNLNLSIFSNLKTIGTEAYYGCDSLYGELVLPESLKHISSRAFAGCKFSGSLTIPNSVEYIGKFAFYECTKLSGIISIGNSVETIDDSAFSMCTNISGNIILGKNLKIIGSRAFFGCNNIKGNLIFPESVAQIGESAFYGCSGFKGKLDIPSKLKVIAYNTFAECNGFSGRLVIPKSVEFIASNAFFGCTGVEEIYFENSSVSIDVFAFFNMHFKCFSGPPDSIRRNSPVIFSSDNFNGKILGESYLNFNCKSFYAIDTMLVILTTIVTSGAFVACGTYLLRMQFNGKTTIKKYTVVFESIIKDAKDANEGDPNEISRTIINNINDRLQSDVVEEGFNMTERQAQTALKNSIDTMWATIPLRSENNIYKKAFDGINFQKRCVCCGTPLCSKNVEETSEDMVQLSMLNQPLT